MEALPGQASDAMAGAEVKAQALWGQREEESLGQIPVERGILLGECLIGWMWECVLVISGKGNHYSADLRRAIP